MLEKVRTLRQDTSEKMKFGGKVGGTNWRNVRVHKRIWVIQCRIQLGVVSEGIEQIFPTKSK